LKKKIAVALGLALIVAVIIGAVIKSNNDSMVEVKTAEVEKMEYEDKVHKENSCIFGIVSAAEIRLITVRVSAAAPNLGFLTIS
jgi:cytidine deaminase